MHPESEGLPFRVESNPREMRANVLVVEPRPTIHFQKGFIDCCGS